jgi:hypothetical protein
VDPIGAIRTPGNFGGTTAIKRVSAPWVASNPDIIRQFTLLDDMTFNPNGIARGPERGLPVERQGTYSWAYMVRRLNANDPRPLEFEVVVYSGRALGLSSSGGFSGEIPCSAAITGPNTVQLTPTGGPIKVRKGGWLCDGNNGYFYRVRSVTSAGGGDMVVVETPFRAPFTIGVCVENVAEVFECSTAE